MKIPSIIASLVAFTLVVDSPIETAQAASQPKSSLIKRLNSSFEKARRNREARKKIRQQQKINKEREKTQSHHTQQP